MGLDDGMRDNGHDVQNRRRRVVIAGHRAQLDIAKEALSDPDGAVRASALVALWRNDALDAQELERAFKDPDPLVRRGACDLCATRDDQDTSLINALGDPDPLVVEAAAVALGERELRRSVGPLSTLVATHKDPRVKEAALGALGAIGDEAGLGAIMGALDEKPTVRRRAVVALAAFEGQEVHEALVRASTDRDWQVREVAEILLAED